jgi:hypothetical protein
MNYNLTIHHEKSYLHVLVTGHVNYENALDAWCKIVKACEDRDCFNILGEMNMNNPISTIDGWKHQEIFQKAGVTLKMKIAWIDLNGKTFEATKFAEVVLRNRGLVNGRLFSNVDEARQWLLEGLL